MFETGSILWLQSFASDGLTLFFRGVSATGYTLFYVPLIVFVTLAIDLRKGFLLTEAMIWASLLTGLVKDVARLPRPTDVDPAVRMLGGSPLDGPFGLPSGHVVGAVVLWSLLFLLFRRRALVPVAAAMIVLMPLSRLYLGRHFPGDVLAGAALGAILVLAVRALALAPGAMVPVLSVTRMTLRADLPTAALALYGVALPLALLAVPPVSAANAGRLLGITAGFVALAAGGLPGDEGTPLQRLARAALGIALYLVVERGVRAGFAAAGLDPGLRAVDFAGNALATSVMLLGAGRLALALRLSRPRAT